MELEIATGFLLLWTGVAVLLIISLGAILYLGIRVLARSGTKEPAEETGEGDDLDGMSSS